MDQIFLPYTDKDSLSQFSSWKHLMDGCWLNSPDRQQHACSWKNKDFILNRPHVRTVQLPQIKKRFLHV